MQLKNSTDYAIRIVCYLAAQERMVSTSELSRKLNVSANYVPKIAKKLKNAKIVTACEGTNGGYMLAKQPENISLMFPECIFPIPSYHQLCRISGKIRGSNNVLLTYSYHQSPGG